MYSGYTLHSDIVFGRGGGCDLTLDLYLPNHPIRRVPLIIYIHGGGWSGLDKGWCPYPMRLLEQEYALASINYRLIQQAPFPACLHDCKAAVRWLRAHADEYHYDGGHIAAWGDSAGGHLAAMLGLTAGISELEGDSGTSGVSSAVQAVCDWYGVTDFTRLGLGLSPSEPTWQDESGFWTRFLGCPPAQHMDKLRAASPITYAHKDAAPMLIMHGDKDTTVLLSQSIVLYEALWQAGADVELYVVRGGDHLSYDRRTTDIPWQAPEVNCLVDAFFYRTLKC